MARVNFIYDQDASKKAEAKKAINDVMQFLDLNELIVLKKMAILFADNYSASYFKAKHKL